MGCVGGGGEGGYGFQAVLGTGPVVSYLGKE